MRAGGRIGMRRGRYIGTSICGWRMRGRQDSALGPSRRAAERWAAKAPSIYTNKKIAKKRTFLLGTRGGETETVGQEAAAAGRSRTRTTSAQRAGGPCVRWTGTHIVGSQRCGTRDSEFEAENHAHGECGRRR